MSALGTVALKDGRGLRLDWGPEVGLTLVVTDAAGAALDALEVGSGPRLTELARLLVSALAASASTRAPLYCAACGHRSDHHPVDGCVTPSVRCRCLGLAVEVAPGTWRCGKCGAVSPPAAPVPR